MKSDAEMTVLPTSKTQEALRDEGADVLLYLLLIADRAGIDLEAAAYAKLAKMPPGAHWWIKAFGSSRKYTELGDDLT